MTFFFLLTDGYFKPQQMDEIEKQVSQLCADLRAVAGTSCPAFAETTSPQLLICFESSLTPVPVVDAFALSDHIINSPLGRYDGQIYEGACLTPCEPLGVSN